MRALIAIGGMLRDTRWISGQIRQPGFDLVLAADSGAAHLARLQLVPDLILGDMDSLDPASKAWLRDEKVSARVFDVRKDGTDTELALDEAISRGADRIVLLGSFSSRRPDHLAANLMLIAGLREKDPHTEILLTDGLTFARALAGPDHLAANLAGLPDVPYIVSLLPLSRTVSGVTYRGLGYPLVNAVLTRGASRSLSNYCLDPEAGFTIDIADGLAIVFLTPEEFREDV